MKTPHDNPLDLDVEVIITCPDHGDFMQTPRNHLAGHGCPVCDGTTQYARMLVTH